VIGGSNDSVDMQTDLQDQETSQLAAILLRWVRWKLFRHQMFLLWRREARFIRARDDTLINFR
jgi:hypothetical protein